jgi:hypothetical protein
LYSADLVLVGNKERGAEDKDIEVGGRVGSKESESQFEEGEMDGL